jgi:hypothetical protein
VRIAAGSAKRSFRGKAWPGIAALAYWFIFISHKLLRWLSPVLPDFHVSGERLAAFGSPWWAGMLATQVAFYVLAVVAWRAPFGQRFRSAFLTISAW